MKHILYVTAGRFLSEVRKMGKKTMLLGIAVIVAAIALSISNIIAIVGGIAGLFIAIIGFFMRDKEK